MQKYTALFSQLSLREQVLILLTGVVVIVMGFYTLVIDANMAEITKKRQQNTQLVNSNRTLQVAINEFQASLSQDPDEALKAQLVEYERKISSVDENLLALTSAMIDPIQMRQALEELLKVQKGVSLLSFELLGAQPLIMTTQEQANEHNTAQAKAVQSLAKDQHSNDDLRLYRHRIKLKLKGSYFQLRDYLSQLEGLSWRFFWQQFNYQLTSFPQSELEIEMYSLSVKREFIGV